MKRSAPGAIVEVMRPSAITDAVPSSDSSLRRRRFNSRGPFTNKHANRFPVCTERVRHEAGGFPNER